MKGGSLASRLKDKLFKASLTPEKIGILIYQVLLALNFCHNIQIMHRNVKPENILIEDFSDQSRDKIHIKLTDFGLAVRIQP